VSVCGRPISERRERPLAVRLRYMPRVRLRNVQTAVQPEIGLTHIAVGVRTASDANVRGHAEKGDGHGQQRCKKEGSENSRERNSARSLQILQHLRQTFYEILRRMIPDALQLLRIKPEAIINHQREPPERGLCDRRREYLT